VYFPLLSCVGHKYTVILHVIHSPQITRHSAVSLRNESCFKNFLANEKTSTDPIPCTSITHDNLHSTVLPRIFRPFCADDMQRTTHNTQDDKLRNKKKRDIGA